MSRITDYGFLFQTTFGTSKTNLINNIQLSQMNSSSVQKQLKAAGIDTNSKKYKAALSEMMKNGNGAMFTNVQAIKNLMSQYDKNGDWIDPNTGLTGLAVTDENRNSYKHIIATVYKGNIIKNLIMDCQSYTKYRPNETTGGIFVSWRRKEELPTGA